jgi:alkanesulfonate monooxygenase SsuD/methylene tetrahydromethanopterin reductase-like flavin-dependent oxidoreductase (luciferase family)
MPTLSWTTGQPVTRPCGQVGNEGRATPLPPDRKDRKDRNPRPVISMPPRQIAKRGAATRHRKLTWRVETSTLPERGRRVTRGSDGGPAVGGAGGEGLIISSPATVRQSVAELQDAGVDELPCWMNFGGMAPEKARRSMRLFADEVLPDFQSSRVGAAVR